MKTKLKITLFLILVGIFTISTLTYATEEETLLLKDNEIQQTSENDSEKINE